MDLKTSQLLDLTIRQRDQLDSFAKQLQNLQKRVYKLPREGFSRDRFKERYGLADGDFSVMVLAGDSFVSITNDSIKVADDPPIFDAPEPEKTLEEQAVELIAKVLPKDADETQRKETVAALLAFTRSAKG